MCFEAGCGCCEGRGGFDLGTVREYSSMGGARTTDVLCHVKEKEEDEVVE
jgi:hypothetical protein